MAAGAEKTTGLREETIIVDLDLHLNLPAEVYIERVENPLLRGKLEYTLPQLRGFSGWI